jgi:transcriptional regulator with XRE-family HTH domain
VYAYGVAKVLPEIIGSVVVRLLREKRESLGLSMNAVASRAGLSHSMISRVERELRKPTLDTLLRITGAMSIELWPLIKRAEQLARAAQSES